MADVMRYYVVCKATDALRDAYFDSDAARANQRVLTYVAERVYPDSLPVVLPFRLAGRPSADVGPAPGEKTFVEPLPDELTVALEISTEAGLTDVWNAVQARPGVFVGGGADVPFAAAEHWSPRDALSHILGDRSAAERLIGVHYIRDAKGLTGSNVNVVIVDQGVDEARIRNELGGRYGTGWDVASTKHGQTGSRHGMMMARNILKVAPDATIFDLPLLPERIADVPTYLNLANAAYTTMLNDIAGFKQSGSFPGPWVLVNAWAIFDRRTDLPPPHDYCDRLSHPFNLLVARAVAENNDVVFGAGNCGQFGPDARCGPGDRGPGCSILGANSHPDVLTVGAARTDALWLGYSSQGPGQRNLATGKPDLCASSQFREGNDAHTVNTGTSAAAAMAAGVIAALRSQWNAGRVPPRDLIRILNATVRPVGGPHGRERFGNGILDARAAFEALEQLP